MLSRWLTNMRRSGTDYWFDVSDLIEGPDESRPRVAELASLVREGYWGEEYLADLAARYGWDSVRRRLIDVRSGSRIQVRRGDLGEALAAQFLQEVEQYEVPVHKLRLKISANQTLPGTDCIAFKVERGTLTEVCFVESKLRIPLDGSVAVKGARQLEQDSIAVAPEMLTFTARQLRYKGHSLAEPVEAFLFSRDEQIETYKLMLFHEKATWDEQVLLNLNDDGASVQPLHVYAARLGDLKLLSDDVFSELGAAEVIDHDE